MQLRQGCPVHAIGHDAAFGHLGGATPHLRFGQNRGFANPVHKPLIVF